MAGSFMQMGIILWIDPLLQSRAQFFYVTLQNGV